MDFTTDIIAHLALNEIEALAKKEIKRQLITVCRNTRRSGKVAKDQIAHKAQSFIRDADKALNFSKIMLEVHGADARNVQVCTARNLSTFEDFVKEATPKKGEKWAAPEPRVY